MDISHIVKSISFLQDYYIVRDYRSKKIVGVKAKDGPSFFVHDTDVVIPTWYKQYNASENYDMGIVLELCNRETLIVEKFVIFCGFIQNIIHKEPEFTQYAVSETSLTNLELMEIQNAYDNYNKKYSY